MPARRKNRGKAAAAASPDGAMIVIGAKLNKRHRFFRQRGRIIKYFDEGFNFFRGNGGFFALINDKADGLFSRQRR